MRAPAPALLAAIAMMHTTHALPRQDLTVRQGDNNLSSDSHVFHHLDRNQRTANRNHDHIYGDNGEGSELYVVKRLADESQRSGWRKMEKESVVDRRFIQDPDYSQGGSNSASTASNSTMATQQPAAKVEKPGEADNSQGRS